MEQLNAVLFDLDNTLLDRTKTFRHFAEMWVHSYSSHLNNTHGIVERMIELDEDGYKDKNTLFTELLEEFTWREKLEHSELIRYYDAGCK